MEQQEKTKCFTVSFDCDVEMTEAEIKEFRNEDELDTELESRARDVYLDGSYLVSIKK